MGEIDCSGYVFPPFSDLEYTVFKKDVNFLELHLKEVYSLSMLRLKDM